MKIIAISVFLSLVFLNNSQAQNIENILASGKKDASTYLGAYIQPLFKGLIYNLNSGWYHSGKTHKKYGFDITISANASFVPQNEKTFTFRNTDYTVLELDGSATTTNIPSVMGQTSTQKINVKIPIDAFGNVIPVGSNVIPTKFKVTSFETLDGIEDKLPISAVPTAMIQVGLGLPSKTDVKLRFVPTLNAQNDVKFNLFGVGLQHNLLQYFAIADRNPLLDLSILGAFTTSTTIYAPKDSSTGVNQESTIKINAYTAQLIGNIDLKIVNFYAGLGYTAGNASMQVKGDYTYTYNFENLTGVPLGNSITEKFHDPIDINYNLNSVKGTIGARLNLAWFKIFADYSFQGYNTANAGISFSFR